MDKALGQLAQKAGGDQPAATAEAKNKKAEAERPDPRPRAVLDLPETAYPLTLTLSYNREDGLKHYLRLTVNKPFHLVLEDDKSFAGKNADDEDGEEDDEEEDV